MYREEETRQNTPTGPTPTIFEAIVRKRCVIATYNRAEVVLAPHVLYTRHDELYVGAVTVTRDAKPPREIKIGTFKLDGLGDLRLSEQEFVPNPMFMPSDEKYRDTALMAVDQD